MLVMKKLLVHSVVDVGEKLLAFYAVDSLYCVIGYLERLGQVFLLLAKQEKCFTPMSDRELFFANCMLFGG